MEYALNYRKDFDRKGQNLTVNMRYYNNEEKERSTISETKYLLPEYKLSPESQLFQKINNDQLDKNLQATVDYVHPLWRKGIFEAGLKYQWRKIDNNYDSFEQDENNVYQPMLDYTNHFLYDEQITAGYLILGNDFGRYSFQAGLRAEYSDIQTVLKETNVKNNQNYFNLFPSLHLNYKLTENDQLQISYSRRIRRPFYRQLNPFHSLSDNRNVHTGNPYLKPVFTDSYEFGYLKYWNKASLNINLYYRHSIDVFRQMTTLDTTTGITFTMPWNFGSEDAYGLEVVGNVNPLEWLNVNGNFNLFQSITVGDFNGTHYMTDYFGYGGRLVAKFNIMKGFDAQLSANYRGPRENPQGKSKADYWADLGVSKEVIKGKGTLTLNVRDVFGTRSFKNEVFDDNYYQKTEFTWSRTTITLNFNYRINQQKRQRRNNEIQHSTDTDMMDDSIMMDM
ncbi:MAG: outer membrane beta-barrel family protein [Lentimicrobiaceae bacterium]|jgi:outer membrane receptor protein involved in Fe transport|nr:outer membrane beta-barrel family protein [Lentimicrobiaceae bacterium]